MTESDKMNGESTINSSEMYTEPKEDELAATDTPASSIKAIDKTTVHRICSGQVVLTLATAVKELVENSIDATSTSVEIRLKEYGSSLIEVSDNGKGVEPCDFEGLTLKHHTSKLQDFGDLIGVKTFGFRGEALSSLCALSNLTIVTRHKSQTVGTKLTYNTKGELIEKTPASRQVGTTVSLQNLFHTLPVRYKEFLRNLKKEFNKMVQILYSYCIITTDVRILCTNQCGKNGRTTIVSTESHSSLKENISSIFGHKQVATLLELKQRPPNDQVLSEYAIDGHCDDKHFHLKGFVSSCSHGKGRSAADRQFYFINSRPCDPAKVIRVVNEVYHHYNKHQFPMVVLNIKMNEDDVDVNVTPDKRQIMVNREKLLLATIKTTLICLYENIPSTLDIQNSSLHCFNSSRTLSTPTSKASPSTPKFSALSERFSRTPTTPLSDDAKFRGMKTGQSSFGGIKRALSSHSDFQAAMKQPKLQAFSFKINGTVQSTKEGKVLSGCTTEEGQDDNLDDSFMEGLEKIDGERLESFSSHLDDIKTCGDELITQSSNQKEKLALSNSNKSSVKFPPKEIHSKTEAFLSSLKARKCPSNLSQRNSSVETSSKNSVQEVVLVEECDKIETKEDDSNDDHERTPPTMIVFDDVNDEDVVMMNPSLTRTKSFTVPFSVEALRRKFSSRRKSAKNGTKNVYRKFRAKIAPTDNHSAEEELKKEISKESFGQMELVGQFNLGFIVTRLHSDLFIVDQHATDEKYNFETLQKSCVLQNQKLILPQTMELTAANEGILMDNMDIFTKNGFEFKVDDTKEVGRRVLLTSMPHSKGWEFKKEDVEEMIFMLSDSPGVMCRPSRINAMFASRACRKSVMIGTSLNYTQMRKLVDHMGELEQPWNCPHGRPTIRHIINLDLLTKLD